MLAARRMIINKVHVRRNQRYRSLITTHVNLINNHATLLAANDAMCDADDHRRKLVKISGGARARGA